MAALTYTYIAGAPIFVSLVGPSPHLFIIIHIVGPSSIPASGPFLPTSPLICPIRKKGELKKKRQRRERSREPLKEQRKCSARLLDASNSIVAPTHMDDSNCAILFHDKACLLK